MLLSQASRVRLRSSGHRIPFAKQHKSLLRFPEPRFCGFKLSARGLELVSGVFLHLKTKERHKFPAKRKQKSGWGFERRWWPWRRQSHRTHKPYRPRFSQQVTLPIFMSA